MDLIKLIEQDQMKSEVVLFNVGDSIKVHYRVKEGTRERIQVFEGTVLKKQGKGLKSTFVVRRIASGVGVERTFSLYSPKIENLEVIRKGKVRRAKLYYLKGRTGRAAKIKEKR